MNNEEITDILGRDSMKDAVLIGTEEERTNYYPAIVGIDERNGRVIYDYDRLIECFADEFFDQSDPEADYTAELETAAEHVDFNVIGSLGNWGGHAPVIRRSRRSSR